MKTLKENATERINELIQSGRGFIAALDAFATTCNKWKDKVINKRFADDFEKIAPGYTRPNGQTAARFWVSFRECFGDSHAVRIIDAIRGNYRTEIRLYKIDTIFYGCRLDSELYAAVIAEIDYWRGIIAADIARYEDWRENFDTVITKYQAIAEQLKELKNYAAMHCYMELPNNVKALQSVILI